MDGSNNVASLDATDDEATPRQLAAIVNGSGDAIFSVTSQGLVSSWNHAAEALFGYTGEEIIGQPKAVLAPANRAAELAEMRARLIAGGPAEHFETQRRRRDGSLVDLLMTESPVADESGRVVGLSVIAHDVTESRQMVRALEASQRQLAEAQRIAHLGSFEADLVTGRVTASEEYHRILGLDPGVEMSVDVITSLIYPDDRPAWTRSWADATETGQPYECLHRVIRPDSEVRWVCARGLPEVDDVGVVVSVTGTLLDETERLLNEAALRASDERFRLALTLAPVGMALRDLDGRWLEVNPALCDLLGRTEDELLRLKINEVVHPDDLELEEEGARRLLARDRSAIQIEERYLHADGHPIEMLTSMALLPDSTGRPAHLIVQVQDISGRKRLEAERDAYLKELRRSNDELEQFASVASHDLSEPLRAISGPVSLLGRRYRGQLDSEADEFIDFAVDGCRRMQALIDDLLAYSHAGRAVTEPASVDCNLVMATVLNALRDQLESSGAVVAVDALPTVWGDAAQLGHVFQNLVSNALKFTVPGTVAHVRVAAIPAPGGWRFTVTDNGIGIEPRHRERAFGMFKRLHGRDEYDGTGIGLALAKRIVERHGGRIGIADGPPSGGVCIWFTVAGQKETR